MAPSFYTTQFFPALKLYILLETILSPLSGIRNLERTLHPSVESTQQKQPFSHQLKTIRSPSFIKVRFFLLYYSNIFFHSSDLFSYIHYARSCDIFWHSPSKFGWKLLNKFSFKLKDKARRFPDNILSPPQYPLIILRHIAKLFLKGGFLIFFSLRYSTLFYLPPLRFHRVRW